MTELKNDIVTPHQSPLIDSFDRSISYLRLSVTDRCDFRCQYCMAEEMTFLPRSQVLSLEELARIAKVFVGLGVRKIRVTGGEPFLHPQFSTICKMFKDYFPKAFLIVATNCQYKMNDNFKESLQKVHFYPSNFSTLEHSTLEHQTIKYIFLPYWRLGIDAMKEQLPLAQITLSIGQILGPPTDFSRGHHMETPEKQIICKSFKK